MTKYVSRLSVLALAACSTAALAHPGHDHSAPSAWLVHLAFLTPVLIAPVLLAAAIGYNKVKKSAK